MPLLLPPLFSPLLVEGCLGIAFAMAEGLLPLWLAVGLPGAAPPPFAPLEPPMVPPRSRRCCRHQPPRRC